MITLTVDGEPAPQGSKSVGRHGGVYEKSKKVKPWRDAIRAAAALQCEDTLAGPLSVEIDFLAATARKVTIGTGGNSNVIKRTAPKYPMTRPDLDKLTRSTLDGLMGGNVYADDGQVVELVALKRYATARREARRRDHRPDMGRTAMTGSLMFLQCVTIGGCVLAGMTLVAAMTAALVGELRRQPVTGWKPGGPHYLRTPTAAELTQTLAYPLPETVEAELRALARMVPDRPA